MNKFIKLHSIAQNQIADTPTFLDVEEIKELTVPSPQHKSTREELNCLVRTTAGTLGVSETPEQILEMMKEL